MPRFVVNPNKDGMYTDGTNLFNLIIVLDADNLATIHQVVIAETEEEAATLAGLSKVEQD